MNAVLEWRGVDEAALSQLAQAFAAPLAQGGVILLEGDLGAGKTTFARALLTTLGVGERIKSPTYSL
ncbi:MAG: tRNA (adenosine(37)-N6)-threonylcarbamoyltransferase complex ATPase subunit type 1 TsaE, partial [Dokdonella sp.]